MTVPNGGAGTANSTRETSVGGAHERGVALPDGDDLSPHPKTSELGDVLRKHPAEVAESGNVEQVAGRRLERADAIVNR